MKNVLAIGLLLLFNVNCSKLSAQQDSISHATKFTLSGLVDLFYVYDVSQPQSTKRQPFLSNYNRHNEINLNLGFIKLATEHKRYRANIALQTGTYVNDNYAAEPEVLKNILEANVGIALHRENKLWLDAGIMPSHIGFETAIATDNATMTRSILAENSPYFMTGAKLTFSPNENWEIAGLILNGWQRIQRLQGSSWPSFGTQIVFNHSPGTIFNWSTFIGTNDPDSTRRMRYFNNFYSKHQLSRRFGLVLGLDIGTQQRTKNSSVFDVWFSPVIIGQFTVAKNWKTAFRAEYYQDKTGIIIPTGTPNGFETFGFSVTLDYAPVDIILCRLEVRWLNSQDNIFESPVGLVNNNFIIGTSMTFNFSENLSR